jgi:hypothetical protein
MSVRSPMSSIDRLEFVPGFRYGKPETHGAPGHGSGFTAR